MESFGERVFQLIATDQYNSIADLMPDLSEYQAIIENSALSQSDKDRFLNMLESKMKNNIESLKRSYTRLREETDQAGIDWEASQLDFIDFRHEKENKVEKADLILNFKYKGVNYKIEVTDCLKYGDTWLMGHQLRFVKGYY